MSLHRQERPLVKADTQQDRGDQSSRPADPTGAEGGGPHGLRLLFGTHTPWVSWGGGCCLEMLNGISWRPAL